MVPRGQREWHRPSGSLVLICTRVAYGVGLRYMFPGPTTRDSALGGLERSPKRSWALLQWSRDTSAVGHPVAMLGHPGPEGRILLGSTTSLFCPCSGRLSGWGLEERWVCRQVKVDVECGAKRADVTKIWALTLPSPSCDPGRRTEPLGVFVSS